METFDVVVLGTGAPGLTAAIAAHAEGASVGIFEKSEQVGGTTAWSGGHGVGSVQPAHARARPQRQPRRGARPISASLSHGLIDEKLAAAYIDAGPEMVAFLEAESPVTFHDRPGLPRLPPGASGREAGRRAIAGVSAVLVRRARRVGRAR